MNHQRLTDILHQLGAQAVPDTFDRWPALRARLAASRPAPARRPRGWRARVLVGLATAAVLLVAVALGAWPTGGDPAVVSAQAVLDKAQAAATNGRTSYHLVATRQTHAGGRLTEHLRQELWQAGDGRRREEMQTTTADGAPIASGVIIDGAQGWAYVAAAGRTRVLIFAWTPDPRTLRAVTPATGSVADLLAGFSAKGCGTARLRGEEPVANRPAYVIAVEARPDGCAAGRATGWEPDQLVVWVDKATFLTLRAEQSATVDGVVQQERYEVTTLEDHVAIPAATFTYTPPADAAVTTSTGRPEEVKAFLWAGHRTKPADRPSGTVPKRLVGTPTATPTQP